MGVEDGRVVFTVSGGDLLLEGEDLVAGPHDGFVEAVPLGFDLAAVDFEAFGFLEGLADPFGGSDGDPGETPIPSRRISGLAVG